jgi:hypothetical protein
MANQNQIKTAFKPGEPGTPAVRWKYPSFPDWLTFSPLAVVWYNLRLGKGKEAFRFPERRE